VTLEVNRWTYPAAWLVRQITRHWWLPQYPRERLASALFSRQSQRHYPFVVPLNGARYRGDFGEYVDWRIFFLGSFERESLNLCRFLAHHATGDVFVDVGAFRGLYDLVLTSCFKSLVAFEPFPSNQTKMLLLLQENGIKNVDLRPVALGASEGELDFQLSPDGTEGQGTLLVDATRPQEITRVPVRRGDDELRDVAARVGLIKIDCEGYERFVLVGLHQTIVQARPFVLFEISDSTGSLFSSPQEMVETFPERYEFFEVSDHSTASEFFLKPLALDALFTRGITNNLACPVERRSAIARYIRPDWRWAATRERGQEVSGLHDVT
jgi:FkbM family methyltransferase